MGLLYLFTVHYYSMSMLTAVGRHSIVYFVLSTDGQNTERKIVFIMSLVGDVCMQNSLSIICIIVMYSCRPTLSNTVSVACIFQV
jgi:hypothetical protein